MWSTQYFSSNSASVKRLLTIVLIALAIALFVLEIWKPAEQMDDAYISYRYAQNLVDGNGLVFNVGEHVEGYTNLSWTLMVALGIELGLAAPAAGHILMMLSGVFLLLMSFMLALVLLPKGLGYIAATAPLILLSTNSFACWTASGLEAPLFAGLATLALYYSVKEKMMAVSFVCILATLTRPEGVLLGGLLLGMHWLQTVWAARPLSLKVVFNISGPCLVYVSYLIAHTIFRVFYYGDIVPNTFHAKVGGIPLSRGLDYLYKFFIDGPGLLVVPACVAAYKLRIPKVFLAYFLLTMFYAVYVGGDVFRLGRFMLPVLPLLIASALVGSCLAFSWGRGAGLVFVGLIVLSGWIALYAPWLKGTDFAGIQPEGFPVSSKRLSARNHGFLISDDVLKSLCKDIQAIRPAVNSMAAVGIGKPGYYMMNIRILDLVGLTDKTVARSKKVVAAPLIIPGHQRTDAKYILAQNPDLILIQKKGEINAYTLPAIVDIWGQEELVNNYLWDEKLALYRRKPAKLVN